MKAHEWMGAFAVALGLHLCLAIALLAADARATVPASLHDDGGIDIGLGSIETGDANMPDHEPAAATPAPARPRAVEATSVTPVIGAAMTSEPPSPEAVVVASTPEAPPATPSAATTTAAATTSGATGTSAASGQGDAAGATGAAGVAGGAQRGGAATYFGKLKAWLNQHKKYPVAAKKEKQQGTVTVNFTIDRAGRLLAARVETSSGNSVLDNAALDLLRKASPMPRLPEGMVEERLVVTLPIEYSLITR